MKVLLDSCVWGGARTSLETAGHDVVWSGEWEQDPGDQRILEIAHSEGRVLVTIDKDFGELAVHRELPHAGIIRIVNFPARDQGTVCLAVLEQYAEELSAQAIITVEQGRVRIRRAEDEAPV